MVPRLFISGWRFPIFLNDQTMKSWNCYWIPHQKVTGWRDYPPACFSIERTYYKLWINTDNRRVRQTSHAAVSNAAQILGAGCQTRECEVDYTGCAKCGRGRSCNNHIPSIC